MRYRVQNLGSGFELSRACYFTSANDCFVVVHPVEGKEDYNV
jgi:hypothetical protein